MYRSFYLFIVEMADPFFNDRDQRSPQSVEGVLASL